MVGSVKRSYLGDGIDILKSELQFGSSVHAGAGEEPSNPPSEHFDSRADL